MHVYLAWPLISDKPTKSYFPCPPGINEAQTKDGSRGANDRYAFQSILQFYKREKILDISDARIV